MIPISIMIEGQAGLTWPRWKRLAAEAEALGFAGMFRSDHFTDAQPPSQESLEMVTSLAYLASHTGRIHFGPLVAPVSFRDPIMLARQAAAIDDLSGGRLILGLGAGWQEREHNLFGYQLGDIPTRFARLEEALEVVTRLLRDDAPEPFEGRFFKLREGASLLPRPQRPGGPQIMIGGNGPKRTLPLVARYASVWNAVNRSPDDFKARSQELDTHLQAAGRKPGDVQRTMMLSLFYGRTSEELDRAISWRKERPEFADKSLEEALAMMRNEWNVLAGDAEQISERIAAYEAAGVQELMLQWFDLDDIERLQSFAKTVMHS